jgi:hypothetical protein
MMKGQTMTTDVHANDPNVLWKGHCLNAVRKFVMYAVVIDNQPVLEQTLTRAADVVKTAISVDEGMGGAFSEQPADTPETEVEIPLDVDGESKGKDNETAVTVNDKENAQAKVLRVHNLNVREISDAFAEQEIACAFVLPDDKETDEEKIFRRIISASIPADIVVIDWYLRDKDPVLTRKVLTAIAEKDFAEKGRLRLICIYTGQLDIDAVTKDAVEALSAGGLITEKVDEPGGLAYGKHHCVLVLNKQDVHGSDLPTRILEALSDLSNGILPSFALAAVAAVRRNVHHIITRFSSDLDAAYVANRLITDPPGEVAELIRELFVSECDTALGLEQVADHFLSENQIKTWLAKHNQPKSTANFKIEIEKLNVKGKPYKENMDISVNSDFLHSLLKEGISDGKVAITGTGSIDFPEKARGKVSAVLHEKEDNPDGERRFARFASLKREAFGNTKLISDEKWAPSLTLGTLLKQNIELPRSERLVPRIIAKRQVPHIITKYFYCLSPSCDTMRLKGQERNFLLLELDEGKGNTNLVILEQNGSQKKLFINPKPTKILTLKFQGNDETGRVQAKSKLAEDKKSPIFLFNTAGEQSIEFIWLGEVRRNRANRDMADLNRNWLRLGIKDSEYLRLAGKGEVVI